MTYISSPLDIHVVKVRILDGGYNFVGTTEPSGRQIFATCDTATLGDFIRMKTGRKRPRCVSCRNTFLTLTRKQASLSSKFKARAATAGEHVITFTGSGARFTESASYIISVIGPVILWPLAGWLH